ncbi:type IV pilin protein [Parashewanella spongiae]|uniref:Type IV pilin protein n=1 Tax=Parashewanella spongiae TaxID=342950 RepID=A0A3A6U3F1_9GAMM|nr:type IV pilin protein [Parashewanella spongiae]MCL1079321.1 type IV pilin protein [Parashewanella spongiae]RJY10406.1 type IV pilin protein [Parashewanella spongiae]
MKRFIKGFSLIEVMIVVAIVGILASISYPSYTRYVAQGARADALAALVEIANLEEQYYLDHRTYTSNMLQLGLNADPFEVENGFYDVDAVIDAANRTFTITATAKGVQATRDSDCAMITLTSAGVKGSANSAIPAEQGGEACWK